MCYKTRKLCILSSVFTGSLSLSEWRMCMSLTFVMETQNFLKYKRIFKHYLDKFHAQRPSSR